MIPDQLEDGLDDASEFNSADVKQIYLDHGMKRHYSSHGLTVSDFEMEKPRQVLVMYG